MSPTPNTTATPPMRQSCDRCHKQKLRCTRAGNSNTGACDRCLRKRAQCVYSCSLPKGRPSMYRSVDDFTGLGSAGPSNPPPPVPTTPVTPVTPKLHHRDSISSQTETIDAHHDVDGSMNLDMSADMNVHPSLNNDSPLSKSIEDTSIDMPTELWPWLEPLSWEDTQIDWGDQDSGQSMFNWHASMNPAQTDVTTTCTPLFPGILDLTATGKDHDGDHNAQRQPGPTAPTGSLCQFPRTNHFGGSSNICFSSCSNKNDLDIVIAELAQLSVRLSPLRRSSYSLAEISEPLIDDATFESVAAWLARGPANMNISSPPPDCHNPHPCPLPASEAKTTGTILSHIFSASHHLLEILRYLKANVGSGTSTLSTPTFNCTPSTSTTSETSYFGLPKGLSSLSSSYTFTPSQCSSNNCNNIIRHLLIACHTMLLNIYAAVLVILERDAGPSAQRDTPVLGDIRLVSVVQLCSYLIERQHQAMDQYLTSWSSPHAVVSQDLDLVGLSGALQPNPPVSDTATREMMKNLKTEVQERLLRLQRTLFI